MFVNYLYFFLLLILKRYLSLSIVNSNKANKILKNWKNIPEGFERPIGKDGKILQNRPKKPKQPIKVNSIEELKNLFSLGYRVQDLDVRGDIASLLEDKTLVHPVVKALYERRDNLSIPGNRTDGFKIAIAIEGGGMRGCVGAGMISAINYLKLEDTIDVVYGSSAGSLVGAYFIADQLPHFGNEVYYDVLTTAGKDFIDLQSLLRLCGLGIFDFRLQSIIDLFTDRLGKPVLNLNYLLDTIVQRVKPLNWEVFWEKQQNKKIVLKVVASGLLSKKAVVMSAEDKNFESLEELAQCMKASMLIPGVAGDVIRLNEKQSRADNIFKVHWPAYIGRKKQSALVYGGEPMTDGLVYEPIPYRSAVRDQCTHIITLRTRGDNINCVGKISVMERMIMSRFFGRKHGLPELVDWMHNQYHKLIYAEDVLTINAANRDFSDIVVRGNNSQPRIYGIAKPAGCLEITRLETSREKIFEGIRYGFAAAYDSLVLDPTLRGQGYNISKTIWPDELLLEVPKHLQQLDNNTIFVNNKDLSDTSIIKEILTTATTNSSSKMIMNDSIDNIINTTTLPLTYEERNPLLIPPPISIVENAIVNQKDLNLKYSKRKYLINILKRLQTKIMGFSETSNIKS